MILLVELYALMCNDVLLHCTKRFYVYVCALRQLVLTIDLYFNRFLLYICTILGALRTKHLRYICTAEYITSNISACHVSQVYKLRDQ